MKSAPPIGPPGWPLLACSGMAAERIRILSAILFSFALSKEKPLMVVRVGASACRRKSSKTGGAKDLYPPWGGIYIMGESAPRHARHPGGSSVKTLQPINPFTLEPAGEYPVQDFAEIRRRLAAARRAAEAWRRIEVGQRVEYLRAGIQYFEANRAAIAKDVTAQMGKPIQQSENEMKGFFERAEWMLDAAEAVLSPEALPPKPGFVRRIEHVPHGVVLIIAPWNYPLLTSVNGVASALLAGNSVLLKH